jgi:hypothetical protein
VVDLRLTCSAEAYNELTNLLWEMPLWRTPHHSTSQAPNVALTGDMPLVWTVDFDQDYILYDRDDQHRLYRFSMPEKCPLRFRQFQHYIPMHLPIHHSKQAAEICSPAAAPRDTVPNGLFNLVYRLVKDYEHNWRTSGFTIERDGLHHLAMGILSCFTLNFSVQKIASLNPHLNPRQACVEPSNLLRWRVWPSPPVVSTVSFGATQVIFTERMDLATMHVNEHFASEVVGDGLSGMWDVPYEGPECYKVNYIVTSLKQIQYFTRTSTCKVARDRPLAHMYVEDPQHNYQDSMTCTPIESFLNGSRAPSKTGVRWMLNAIHGHAYPLHTRVHNLPVELQELILDYVYPSPANCMLHRAVFSSQLNIGIPFNFESMNRPIVRCDLVKRRALGRYEPEYHVWFWDVYVGLTYQVDDGSERVEPVIDSKWKRVQKGRAQISFSFG